MSNSSYFMMLNARKAFDFGNALLHDGVDDIINHNTIIVGANNPFTYSIWFNTEDLTDRVYASGGSGQYGLTVRNATTLRAFLDNSVYDFTVPTMSTSTWYMATTVREIDNTLRIYLNDTESTTGGVIATENMIFDVIGSYSSNPLVGFKGKLNKPGYDDSAITPAQVTALFKGGFGEHFDVVVPNPVAHWRFNESGSDNTAAEINGNYDGALGGYPATRWVPH